MTGYKPGDRVRVAKHSGSVCAGKCGTVDRVARFGPFPIYVRVDGYPDYGHPFAGYELEPEGSNGDVQGGR